MQYDFDPNDILHLPLMANLATVCTDGPRNAPVWFIWEDESLWLLGSQDASSVRRLASDPRCAVEIVHYDNRKGFLLHLGFRGNATIERVEPARFERLLSKYLSTDKADWNSWFVENIARINDPVGRMIRLIPVSTYNNNVSYFRTGPELSWPPKS